MFREKKGAQKHDASYRKYGPIHCGNVVILGLLHPFGPVKCAILLEMPPLGGGKIDYSGSAPDNPQSRSTSCPNEHYNRALDNKHPLLTSKFGVSIQPAETKVHNKSCGEY